MQPTAGPPTSADLYRVADLALFQAGENLVLAYARMTDDPQLLRADIVDLVMQCREFKTLDDHVQSYCRGRQASRVAMRAMRQTLLQLADQGYLVSQWASLEQLHGTPQPTTARQITSIAFPTSERVATLQRGMTSFVEHCRRFGRTNDFVVVDDSPTPATQRAYRELLAQFQTRDGVRCVYAGSAEKRAFAERISALSGLPQDIVEFMCVGSPEYGVTTVGANRNALLLHTVGDLIFSADDDIVCQVAAPPEAQTGLRVSSWRNPLNVWFFADRGSAEAAVTPTDVDILGIHEQWLGADTQSCLTRPDVAAAINIDEAAPELLRRLRQPSSRVALTLNGTLGDCSWDNPHFFLFQRGATFKRLTRSEEAYRAAQASREMIQSVAQVTLAEYADPMFAMCMGLDNRALLPPFTPLGRGEEVGFGAALSQCFDGAYAVNLPWTLLHAPANDRGFSEHAMFHLGFNDLIPSLINHFDPGFTRSAAERLVQLGRQIESLGRLSQPSFAEWMRLHILEAMSGLISGLEERLGSREAPPPAFWVQHARAVIARARQNALAPLDEIYLTPGGQPALQRLLMRYGQGLQAWPAMVDAAGQLRAQGHRLAQPV